MIRSLEIKNLRGIKQGRLADLSPLVILVGPNGSGKSTILDALLIGADPDPKSAILRSVHRHKGVAQAARWLFWRADESDHTRVKLSSDERVDRDCRIRFEHKAPGMLTVIRAQFRHPHGSWDCGAELIFKPDGSWDSVTTGRKPPVVVPEARLVEVYAHEQAPLHSLYSRAVQQGRREQTVDLLQALVPGLRNLEILTEGDTPVIHLVFKEHSVPAALGGDGIHALLRLTLELASRPRGLVLLEEPEIHQHPGAIRQSVRAILEAIRREIQVVLSTHSLELIDALLAEASDEDLEKVSLYRLQLDAGILKSHRSTGPEVARVRTEIEDDLR